MLLSVLGAYVCYRPDVGYVQGMSFLAAILILNMDPPDAFICFANLLNRHCLHSFFTMSQPMVSLHTFKVFFGPDRIGSLGRTFYFYRGTLLLLKMAKFCKSSLCDVSIRRNLCLKLLKVTACLCLFKYYLRRIEASHRKRFSPTCRSFYAQSDSLNNSCQWKSSFSYPPFVPFP